MSISIQRLVSYYRPQRTLLAAVLACGLAGTALTLIFPLLVLNITNTVLAHGVSTALPTVYRIGGLMVLLLIGQSAAAYFVDYHGHQLGARMENTLRRELFEHLQTLSLGFFDGTRTGELMSRITNDLMLLGEFFHHAPEEYLTYSATFVGAFVILCTINVPLTLVIFAFLPVVGAFVVVFNRVLNRTLYANRETIAAVNAQAEESLAGIRVVQSFANEPLEIAKFHQANQRFLESRRHTYRADASLYTAVGALVRLITVAIVVLGSVAIVHQQLTLGDLITYLLYVSYVVEPIQRLAFMTNQLQEGMTGLQRFLEITAIKPAIPSRPDAHVLTSIRGRITFERVSFRYQPSLPPVLADLTLTIEPGEYVALVGPSGAGKSTLCALIPRFYDVTAGSVLIDGLDVRDLDVRALRRQIGIVHQEVYLFAGTVMDNIRYGNPEASDADVIAAAKSAHADAFIQQLAHGYDTEIGQRGVTLSGGQRQRLSIARVVLKDPPVLIFDEATSALDYESELAVQRSLETMARGRTTLVIAHRLSTVRHAQRIVVLTPDGIAEQGTHEALLARDGVYARLYAHQWVL